MLVNLFHHPQGACAPSTDSTPHQLRGFLHDFSVLKLKTAQFAQCTACSCKVVEAYKTDSVALLREALKDPISLERISGLAELKAVVDDDDAAFESVAEGDDW